MGGSGSGRWYRWDSKATTESQHRINIFWMRKQGFLKPGVAGSFSWSCGGEKTGSIRYRIDADHKPCFFGGFRKWFICPRCWKRVAVLYGAGKFFLCRHCYNLTYSSQQESTIDRIGRKARKIRARLGASTDLFDTVRCSKPKGMHWKTFQRLREKADDATDHFWLVMGQWMRIYPK